MFISYEGRPAILLGGHFQNLEGLGWGGGGHITWGSFKINFMKVGQGGNKRELKSNVALTAVNSKHRSYITTVDKVCDELRHYL